jgi:DNA repair protein RAD7
VAQFFNAWKAVGHEGLFEANFAMNHDLKDEAMEAMLTHSGSTIENLSVKGWRTVSEDSLTAIGSKCPNLRQLDVGWCRQLTDFSLKEILEGCDKLERVKAWGTWCLRYRALWKPTYIPFCWFD